MVIAKTLITESKKSKLSCRPSGWAPLVYPVSALLRSTLMQDSIPVTNTTEVNPFFPLDRHVLMASIRELLILGGAIDSQSLTVSANEASYICHKDMVLFVQHSNPEPKPKRKMISSNSKRKKAKIDDATRGDGEGLDVIKREKAECAESLAGKILLRAVDPTPQDESIALDPTVSAEMDEKFERLPRKVSDADMELHAPVSDSDAIVSIDAGDKDMSRYVHVSHCGSMSFLAKSLPKFLETSIVFEMKLRNLSYHMVSAMLKPFENETIRLFMGYRTKSLKRQRIMRMVSDYLFDVSHAMFAWKQTEEELLADWSIATPTVQSFTQKLDDMVRDSLFDSRALKKIGGFEDSSILKHAVEIGRSACKQQPWEEFAKTVTGRRLLAHHRSGNPGAVGATRRGRRIRYKWDAASSCDSTESVPRSRASSIGSTDEIETVQDEKEVMAKEERSIISNVCDVSEITLHRESKGCSWGVKLAREGDICVVDRADNESLRCGDMILSVKNERNQVARSSSSGATSIHWFQDVVNLFKTSNQLTLVVRRVGV